MIIFDYFFIYCEMITVKKARLCYVLLGILLGCSCSDVSRDEAAEMDRFVTELMGKMTLHEKLGQLNLPSGGDMVTGTVMNGELSDMIRKQEIGRQSEPGQVGAAGIRQGIFGGLADQVVLPDCFFFNLTNALTCEAKFIADFFQCHFLLSDTEKHLNDFFFSIG